MAKARVLLHLALALTLMSLTCDLGAVCATLEGNCCCPIKMQDGSSPCTEMSGDGDASGAPEPAAAIESGERFAAAALDAAPSMAASGDPAAVTGFAAAEAPLAAPTPLYLSHCAFLC